VTSRFLLDSNVLSEPLRPDPNRKLLERLRKHQHEIATSSIVWHELLFGASRLPASRKRQAIEQYLAEVVAATIPILPYDETAAAWHATERGRLVSLGRTPPFVDGQIAAIAKIHDLTLVTRNTADFADFAELRVQNWHR
jgi:tRNA(fMet)-specific endonuclease VapC